MNTLISSRVNVWRCDALEARLQSAEEERGRLVAAVMSTVGVSYYGREKIKKRDGMAKFLKKSLLPFSDIVVSVMRWVITKTKARIIVLVSVVIALLVVITSGEWFLSHPKQDTSGKFIILVAPIWSSSSESQDSAILNSQIYEQLKAATASYQDDIEITVSDQAVVTHAGALELGKKSNADVVIWGRADSALLELYIESLLPLSLQDANSSGQTIQFQPQAVSSELKSFEVQQKIGAETTTYVLFLTGYYLYSEGYYLEASQRFAEIIQSQETSTSSSVPNQDLYLYLGLSYLNMERYDLAIDTFTRTLQIAPQSPNAFVNRGLAYSNLAYYDKAIEDYNHAIELDPNNADSYNNRGLTNFYLGKYNDAVQDYTKVITFDSSNLVAYKNRGLAYQALGRSAEANTDFDKFRQLRSQIQAQVPASPTHEVTAQPNLPSQQNGLIEKYKEIRNSPFGEVFQIVISALLVYLIGIAALLISAWRLGSNIFSRSWLTTLASKPLLIIPGMGNWALFLGYNERLLNQQDVKRVANKYFGLPALDPTGNNILPDLNGNTLNAEIAKALNFQKPVLIMTKGGGGKTTLLARWSYLALINNLSAQLKDFKPIFVTPAYYNGNLVEAIASVLRERDGVAVDKDIMQAQLESGKFLILFDGVSEVEGDQNKGLQEILRAAQSADYRNCRFVITSRPGLNVPPETTVFHLQPLTSNVVLDLLPLYKLDKEQEYQVKGQLTLFGAKPIEPLLFSMILEQGKNAQFSRTRSQLYEKYFRRLLRVNKDTIWEGWMIVLGEFANWFTIETGRRGVGIIHEKLVDKISGKESDVKTDSLLKRSKSYYGLPVETELVLLETLKSSGIMQQSRRWRFAHDTFEEYFAACFIVSYINSHEKLPDLSSWRISEAQVKSFVGVIEFIKEIADEEILKILLDSDLPPLWNQVLTPTKLEEEG